ncbi:MAG: phytanoyl-CoA dioxygenase family protein, partial [Actinomycetes bacterium]
LEQVLRPFRLLNVTYVVKWPGGASALPVHQDWSYVDETRAPNYTVWFPLDDVGAGSDAGVLGVVPRSHRVPADRRGANSRPWYLPYRDQLDAHLQMVPVPIGSMMMFHCGLLHGSRDNRSNSVRRAVTAMVTPATEPLRYYHVVDDAWQVYDVDESFFVENGPVDLRLGHPSGATLVDSEPVVAHPAPLSELEQCTGVVLEPVTNPIGATVDFAGTPLGASSALGATTAVRLLHRWRARRAPRPFAEAAELPELGALAASAADLGAAWASLVADGGTGALPASRSMRGWAVQDLFAPDPSGRWSTLSTFARGFGAERAWLAVVGPGDTLAAARSGDNGAVVVAVPMAFEQPSGTFVVQAGDEIRSTEPGYPLAFDPTYEHASWNFGSSSVPLLVLQLPRPLPAGARVLRDHLRRTGALLDVDLVDGATDGAGAATNPVS